MLKLFCSVVRELYFLNSYFIVNLPPGGIKNEWYSYGLIFVFFDVLWAEFTSFLESVLSRSPRAKIAWVIPLTGDLLWLFLLSVVYFLLSVVRVVFWPPLIFNFVFSYDLNFRYLVLLGGDVVFFTSSFFFLCVFFSAGGSTTSSLALLVVVLGGNENMSNLVLFI